ncbi:hypothetical protein PROFUN_04582 [Planoprotostelium fungivorum]|uniref:Cytochrome c oxidase assembly protein COX20, mitochondrial n=1 Tax=Planoprotostelium fungivorum TaxID=1890364 RepID=A0A2P6NBM0_9EUKA|nr:hypothetical protein PROFUN_04582 [Planoprotostelium fungivorum]
MPEGNGGRELTEKEQARMEILNRKFSFLAPQRQACFRESMLWGFGSAFAVSSAWYLYRGGGYGGQALMFGSLSLLTASSVQWTVCRREYNKKKTEVKEMASMLQKEQERQANIRKKIAKRYQEEMEKINEEARSK